MEPADQTKTCTCCGETFLEDENDYVTDRNGNVYCESCRDEYLFWCEHCDEYSDSEHFVHIADRDEWWCDDCAERLAHHCEECGDWVAENYGNDSTALCARCYENNYCTKSSLMVRITRSVSAFPLGLQ